MKQLITFLLCLFTLFAEAQVNPNDTTKYFKSYDYGFSYKRLQAREAFIFPTDTVINKLGAVSLNGVIYLGNGTKWTSIGGAGTTPTLQQVTTAGSITTNAISVNSLNIGAVGSKINLSGITNNLTIYNEGTSDEILNVNNGANGYLKFGGGSGQYVQINTTDGNVELTAPSTNGIIPISVNGYTANTTGAITIPTIDTSNKFVNRLERTPGKDSIIYFVGANRFAIKDSVSNSDTSKVVIAQVHNATTTTLLRGEVVYLFGANGSVASVKRANNKIDSTSSKTFGLVRSDIPAGGIGFITTQGQIEKLNLGTYNEGDVLWLDSLDGKFTKVKPQAPYHGVFLGIVERANNGNGLAYIKPQNGVELDEVHDVQINNLLNNQIIVYSDTQKVWKNRSIYSVVDTINRIATKSNVALKLNISDTSSMLSSYSTRINSKLNISDTSSMLSPYARTNSVNASLALKLNISDSASMLSKYLRKTDTASLSNRISNEVSNLDLLQLMSYGIKAETYGVTLANMSGQQSLTTNRFYLYPFNWNVSDTIRGISWFNRAAFTNVATNYNGIAIYSLSGGTLNRVLFTANDGTFWNSTINTWSSKSITPTFLAKGLYFIGYQFSGSGTPTMGSGDPLVIASTQSPSDPPSGVNPNGIKFSTFIANTTSAPPTSIAMSTTTAVVNVPYFMFY